MSYSLHIERSGSEISLEEWLAAAATLKNVRQRKIQFITENPVHGDIIKVKNFPGDLEVVWPRSFLDHIFGKNLGWRPAFFFNHGSASFLPPEDIDSPEDPVRNVATQLARILNASIIGDDGEEYKW